MTYIKSIFILYLIISSFTLSICETIITAKDNKNFFLKLSENTLEKLKEYIPGIAGVILFSQFSQFETILTTIGSGIAKAASALYTALLETWGSTVTGYFVIGTTVVVILGTIFVVYKLFNAKYIKVGEFEYCSSDDDSNCKNFKNK